jgi:ABC-type uncharacterized transport system permease subunit
MHLVVIAWIYIIAMVSLTRDSVIGGLVNFFALGIAPLALFLWLGGRRRRRQREQKNAP